MGFLNYSRSDPFEKSYFRIAKWLLEVIGVWPLSTFNWWNKMKTFFCLLILFTAIFGEIRLTWLARDEPLTAINAICPCLTKLISGIKLICFIIYHEDLALLLTDLYEHLAKECQNQFKNAIVAGVSHLTLIWSFVLAALAFSSNFSFGVNPLFKYSYQRLSGDENAWIGLPFEAALPYKDMKRLTNKFLYAIVYCILSGSGTVTVIGYPGTDGTFICFCMYFAASYKCLQDDLNQALKVPHGIELDSEANNLIYNKLTKIIQRQQYLNKMFVRFNDVYRFMIFLHFVFASIIMGMVLVNLTLSSGIFAQASNLFYFGGACSQLYAFCYGAEKVNENCTKISQTLYFSDWYRCNKKVKTMILFIVAKSQDGILLKAPFFSPSLELFTSIIKASGSYFTLLQTVL